MAAASEVMEKKWWRWFVLVMVSMIMFGSYYVYDSFSPINDNIQTEMGVDNSRFGLLFSFYALPNIFFLLVIAGFLLDKIGVRKAGGFYAFLILLGTLITAVGAGKSFVLMLIGRMIFGFGSEAALLATNKVISRWFRGKELGLAFGLNITVMRLGSILALNTSAQIASRTGSWRMSVWTGVAVMLVSFILFMVYILKDKRIDAEAVGGDDERIRMKDILNLNPAFWAITLLCLTFYSAVFPFTNHAARFLQVKFAMSAAKGGQYTSYIMLASMVFTPIMGFLVDKLGHRGKIMFVGSLLIVPAHLLLGLTHLPPYISFILLGVSFSLVPAAMWPAVPILVREKFLGTAYGLIAWIQNVGLAAFPWLAGKLVDISYSSRAAGVSGTDTLVEASGGDYTNMQWMFASLGFFGLIFSVMLLFYDKRHKSGLELPSRLAQGNSSDSD
ncbi:MAG: MFS transporter [Candidatus Krumholzibacteriota bacterium]|nr:MFS transporter [Candidatus Krumholzibacteriota bacterium]